MPHEGYANPIMNDGPRLHSDMPVSELTEHVTRAIEASDVSSAPPVAKNRGRGNTRKLQLNLTPTEPNGAQGLKTPNASARSTPRSTTLARSIPRRARLLDPRLQLA